MGSEVDLLANYPKSKRDVEGRGQDKSPEDRRVAREFGADFFDGDRKYGYGGFRYHPRFWEPVIPTLQQHFGLSSTSSVLDVGCAKGFMLHDLARLIPGIVVKGVDISDYAMSNAIEDMKPHVQVADARMLPFADHSFDVVISINTVHNLERAECAKALREIQRVSRGRGFVTVDAYVTEEEKERMFAWNLTAQTIMHVEEWKAFFDEVGYAGDYFLVHSMTPEVGKQLLFQVKRIRHVEEEIARRYAEGQMRCPTHLSVGQEGVAAAVGLALQKSDFAVSGHRAHAHFLGKGGNLKAMLAELYGKATGCSRGKGGSMHLIDESAGFMGSTAIVGGTVPVGVGLAYGMMVAKTNQVSCIFHGDAVVEAGVFFESVNFAVLKSLPVLFVCENNLYSVYSPFRVRQPEGRKIAAMVEGFGLRSASGDGNDAQEVYEMTSEALRQIRSGGGPRFLEFATYRWREHCGPNFDNDIGYRTEAEFHSWKERDPIERLEKLLLSRSDISASEIARMDESIQEETNIAFEFAIESPFPSAESAFADLYGDMQL